MKLNINDLTPVSVCLKEICEKATHIRFTRKAQHFITEGQANVLTGATQAGRKASSQTFKFKTSQTSHHGLLTVLDKSTRQIVLGKKQVVTEGQLPFERFDWRTFIFFSFPFNVFIPTIEAYVGNEWVSINLENRRFWNQAPQNPEEIARFIELKKELTLLETRNGTLKSRSQKTRKHLNPDEAPFKFSKDGKNFILKRLQGKSDKIVDSEGNAISKVLNLSENKEVSLVLETEKTRAKPVPIPEKLSDILEEEAERQIISIRIKEILEEIREIELSIIEEAFIARCWDSNEEANGSVINYGGEQFTVKFKDGKFYSFADEVVEKLKSGEYRYESVDTIPQWRCYIDSKSDMDFDNEREENESVYA